ncbi:MAG TPA: acetolactate synthase 3 large subunit, partial [Gammaproteobacteria bacterium]|nr:acetolactate synthase 3 large subunit [Gammaproteobacteria bacterium]
DTTGITRAATKHNYLVHSTDDLARLIHEAFYVATHGRPGPVLIDIPKDVILGTGLYLVPEDVQPRNYKPKIRGDREKIEDAIQLLAAAKKPIIYVGGGVINSGQKACQLATQLVRMTGYPCTTTLMALGAFPASDPQFVGMPGMHGTYEANMAMHQCDVMFNIGARFDDRVTGKVGSFSPGSKKIHVDIDPSSLNKTIVADIGIIGDAGSVLEDMIGLWDEKQPTINTAAIKSWWNEIEKW